MIGRIIGNYQITSELARGGMGTVYYGHHVHLPREVVVKSIFLSGFSPSNQAQLKVRFRREAYIQSQLDHPNIVRVYEFFALDDNYYLVMEYVPGISLRDLSKRQKFLAPSRAVSLCRQALAALHYAHKFTYIDEGETSHIGIIHRDIKPANLLLDSKGRLKITDFGIVKVMGEEGITQGGLQPGTVEYMSPEQLLGLNVDERSDIYSLAVTFYELLTGRLPFPRTTTCSDWEVRKGHIEMEPPSILGIRPDIHPELATIIMRALAKHPSKRFQSAEDFFIALQNYEHRLLASDPTSRATSNGPGQRQFTVPVVTDRTTTRQARPGGGTYPQSRHALERGMAIPLTPSQEILESDFSLSASGITQEALGSNHGTRKVYVSVPARGPKRKWSLAVTFIGLLLLGTATWAYLFSGQLDSRKELSTVATKFGNPTTTQTTTPEPPPNTRSRQTTPPEDDSALKQARIFQQRERYTEAIQKYEEHLRRNPRTIDVQAISDTLVMLRQFQDLMRMASSAMEMGKYSVARQHYSEALKLRPDSEIAKAGLAQAESSIKAALLQQFNGRPFIR